MSVNNQEIEKLIINFILDSNNESNMHFPLTKGFDYETLINEFNKCKYIKIKYYNSNDNLENNIITKVKSNNYFYYSIITFNN